MARANLGEAKRVGQGKETKLWVIQDEFGMMRVKGEGVLLVLSKMKFATLQSLRKASGAGKPKN